MSKNFGFIQGSPKGRQKVKRNLRRYLRALPAHKRLDKFEKMWRKRQYQRHQDKDER